MLFVRPGARAMIAGPVASVPARYGEGIPFGHAARTGPWRSLGSRAAGVEWQFCPIDDEGGGGEGG